MNEYDDFRTEEELGALRTAAGPVLAARPIGAVPYGAIVAAGRRRQRNRVAGGIAGGVAVVAATALAVPGLAFGRPGSPASAGSGGSGTPAAPPASQGSATPGKGSATPTSADPAKTQGQAVFGLLESQQLYSIGHGTYQGHPWEVKVTIEPDERAFMDAHREILGDSRDYDHIPYSWFLPRVDGKHSGLISQDLALAPTAPGNPLATTGVPLVWDAVAQKAAAVLEYGPVNDPAVAYYTLEYRTHTDRIDPVSVGGHRYVTYTVSAADRPTAAVAYDANGKVITRGTGFVVDYFPSSAPPGGAE